MRSTQVGFAFTVACVASALALELVISYISYPEAWLSLETFSFGRAAFFGGLYAAGWHFNYSINAGRFCAGRVIFSALLPYICLAITIIGFWFIPLALPYWWIVCPISLGIDYVSSLFMPPHLETTDS